MLFSREAFFPFISPQTANYAGGALVNILGPVAVPFDDKYNQPGGEEPPTEVVEETRHEIHSPKKRFC